MSLRADTIKPAKGSRRTKVRVGRGNGSGKGTYSTRGLKGQKSRSGASGLALIGIRASLRKIPKLRGFNSPNPKRATVTLTMLEETFKDGETVSPSILEHRGVIASAKFGAKIVTTGELKKKLNVSRVPASKSAIEAIEKAGGTYTA